MDVAEIQKRLSELEEKIRSAVRESIATLEGEGVDYKTMSYDELLTVIKGEPDISILEEVAEDVIDHPNLSDVEKYNLLREIYETVVGRLRI